MTHLDKMRMLQEIFDQCLSIADKKGKDYSGTGDGMGNFRDFGWQGIVVRMGDKYHRIKNILNSGVIHVEDETIDDTLMDLINYSALCLMMRREGGVTADSKA